MAVVKVAGGWKVVSSVTGKRLKKVYRTKQAAVNASRTSSRRSQRRRSRNAKSRRR